MGGGSGEVELEYILFEDGDAIGPEKGVEAGSKFAVELERDDAASLRGEGPGDGSLAGADFYDGLRGDVAESGDDAADGGLVAQEVLAELGLLGHTVYGRW